MKLHLTFIFGLLFNLSVFSQSEKLEIYHLTDNYYIFTTYNSFKGIQFPSNGMYLVTNEGVALFDTPWDTTQFQPLLDSIHNRHKKEVVFCISTHSHEDRTAGLDYYKSLGIKTYTTQKTDSISNIRNEKRAEYLIDIDTIFKLGAYSFQTFYPGEAHTPDNIVI